MRNFSMNGYDWTISFVPSDSKRLIDRTGDLTVATTDPSTGRIYLAENLYGDFLTRVLIHELGHCAMFSFHLLDSIHSMVKPEYWIEAEEWVCNFLADYGQKIFAIAYEFLGNEAISYIPIEYEKLIA